MEKNRTSVLLFQNERTNDCAFLINQASLGSPNVLARAAGKMETALRSGMGAEALRTTLELCTAAVMPTASSVYGLYPRTWKSTKHGTWLTTYGEIPFALPDVSELFRTSFLAAFDPGELASQKLLPMFFVTLPFLKRVEICAVWTRNEPQYRAVLLTWLMALWRFDCRSARQDLDRNKILSIARYDSMRTILKFVGRVAAAAQRRPPGDRPADDAAFVRAQFEQFVAEEAARRTYPDWLSVEELCRNEDWAYAGLYDRLIPFPGPQPIVKLMDALERKGSGSFAKIVRSGACDRMDIGLDQLFLFLIARSVRYDNLKNKTLKCLKLLAKRWPELLLARDKSGDGPLWQLFYSGEAMPLHHLRAVAQYLIRKGCDPEEKSSIGLSYNDVVGCAEALTGRTITLKLGSAWE